EPGHLAVDPDDAFVRVHRTHPHSLVVACGPSPRVGPAARGPGTTKAPVVRSTVGPDGRGLRRGAPPPVGVGPRPGERSVRVMRSGAAGGPAGCAPGRGSWCGAAATGAGSAPAAARDG